LYFFAAGHLLKLFWLVVFGLVSFVLNLFQELAHFIERFQGYLLFILGLLLMVLNVDVFLMRKVGHFVVKFKAFDDHKKFRDDVRIGTVSRKHEKFHNKLDFLESLQHFMRLLKLRHFHLSDIKQLHAIYNFSFIIKKYNQDHFLSYRMTSSHKFNTINFIATFLSISLVFK
jgi:hypothetical protein